MSGKPDWCEYCGERAAKYLLYVYWESGTQRMWVCGWHKDWLLAVWEDVAVLEVSHAE